MQSAGRRRIDHAERRDTVFDQADVHRVVAAAPDELLGSIERVDEETGVAVRGDSPGRHFLFGDDRDPWSRTGERCEDDELGRVIGFGDR